MDKTKEPVGHLSSIIGIGLLLVGLVVFGVVEQKAWSHQAELTKNFEACMESAPFKNVSTCAETRGCADSKATAKPL